MLVKRDPDNRRNLIALGISLDHQETRVIMKYGRPGQTPPRLLWYQYVIIIMFPWCLGGFG